MGMKRLLAAIELQDSYLGELLAVLERESGELGNVDIAAMTKTNQDKEELYGKITTHSDELKQAIVALAELDGLSAGSTLGEIAEKRSRKGDPLLLQKQEALQDKANRIQQVAAMNLEVAQRFSATVTLSLDLITRLVNQSNMYGSGGGYQQRQTGAVIINMEA